MLDMLNVFSAEFWMALFSIIVIDLVLAGDNAIVIGMAARNLPARHQKKAIFWGMFGAITIRIIATLVVVWLLEIPWLLLIGGLVLIWISYKLLVQEESHEIEAKDSLFAAIRTIVIADAAMGLDNVIAVAGAAHGTPLLVIIGLLITVPIIVWGSTLFIKLMNRFPWLIYLGAGILAYTAAKMITDEEKLRFLFEGNAALKYGFDALVIVGVLLAGWLTSRAKEHRKLRQPSGTNEHVSQ
jgi:YjbE family integral membrane protein